MRRDGEWWRRAVLVAFPALGLASILVGLVAPPSTAPVSGDALDPLRAVDWIARILLCAGAVVSVVIGSGLILRRSARRTSLDSLALVWIPGTVYLALTGLVAWLLASSIDPAVTSAIALTPLLAWLAWRAARAPARSWFQPREAAVCGLMLLVVLVGVAKATWSAGPNGELYSNQVSRTLEASDRPDSRIQYHVIQLISHDLGPHSSTAGTLFFPYTFSDRGALAGLAAAPIVLSEGADPPRGYPYQAWNPFDGQGFAAYRIALEVLSATVVLSTFGLLRTFASPTASWAGTVLVALTPFVIHETYFTWPKLLAASFGVAALTALLGRRPGIAGALLGLAYLAHSVGLFVAIGVVAAWFVLAWWGPGGDCRAPALVGVRSSIAPILRSGAWIVVGIGAGLLVWRLANGSHYTQGTFFSYFGDANTVPAADVGDWLSARLASIANTLIPFWVFAWDHGSRYLNPDPSTYAPHPLVIPFFLQYWTSLPFAVGLVYFPAFVAGLWRFARHHTKLFVSGLVLPFAVFVIYWGSYTTGLMREGLQGWIVFALIAAFIGHTLTRPKLSQHWARVVRACLTLRGLEVLAMLMVPTVTTNRLIGSSPFVLTDVVSLAAIVGGVAILMTLSWRAFEPSAERGQSPRQVGEVPELGGAR